LLSEAREDHRTGIAVRRRELRFHMKIPGVVGGIGPEATAAFYLETLRVCREREPAVRPEMVISSVRLTTEGERALLSGRDDANEEYVRAVSTAVGRLERAGVDFLVVPSNTVCLILRDLTRISSLPVLDTIGETVASVGAKRFRRVVVLGTSQLSKSGVYRRSLEARGVEVVPLAETSQRELDGVIRSAVSSVIAPRDIASLEAVVEESLERGAEGAILACTDLQAVARHSKRLSGGSVPIVDSLTCLAESVVRTVFEGRMPSDERAS
jgi:aspartate racemase